MAASIPLKIDELPLDTFAKWLASGEMIPFVGAGATPLGLPTGIAPNAPELAHELIVKMGTQYPGSSDDGDLAAIAQYFVCIRDRYMLGEFLYERLEETPRGTQPGTVARTLAAIPATNKPLFLITTNYDTAIERAFRAAQRPLCVITQSVHDVRRRSSFVRVTRPDGSASVLRSGAFEWDDGSYPRGCTFLFKMHGSLHEWQARTYDNLIITEDDYVDFMASFGGMPSAHFPPRSLAAEYKVHPFLFLGYSLRDWNFRVFLRVLARSNALSRHPSRRHWAIQSRPRSVDVALWESRHVSLADADLDDVCTRLLGYWGS